MMGGGVTLIPSPLLDRSGVRASDVYWPSVAWLRCRSRTDSHFEVATASADQVVRHERGCDDGSRTG